MPPFNVQVNWRVSTDPDFRAVVKAGSETATPELAHSVHAEVSRLRPSVDYWFRFRAGSEESRKAGR
jgi:alkaline phosphatase D